MEQEDEFGGGTTDEYDPEDDAQELEEGQEEEYCDRGGSKRKRHRSSQGDEADYKHSDLEYKRSDSRKRHHRSSHDVDHKKSRRAGSDRSESEQNHERHAHYPQDGNFSDQEDGRDSDRRRRRRSDDKERDYKGKHRRHGRHRKSRHKARMDDSRSSQDMEAEDGEILEDGEIEEEGEEKEDEENGRSIDVNMRLDNQSMRKKFEREMSDKSDDNKRNEDFGEEDYEDGEGSEQEATQRQDKRRYQRGDRHRGDWGRDRRERRGRRDDKQRRKGKKPPKYHDYDNVDDDGQQGWMSQKKGGSYKQDLHSGDKDNYGNYDSPPGPYDSPSDEEDYDGHRSRSKKNKSMLSMLGDDMLDPNIAVEEGQELYKKAPKKKKNFERGGRGGHENHDRGGNKRKNFNRDYENDQPKKKPLLKTPMEERPVCRFFKDGKCHKGQDCPFNHEKTPRKPELCKYYLNSYCSKEDNCIFMHSEFPCKFYHTGQECYGGDNCKFSHDPLTEETQHLIEKRYHNDSNLEFEEDRQRNKNRPSLLGSPPRHLLQDQQERIKKIPSLFDIETRPPVPSPNKQNGPGGPPNRMPPPHMQPRPAGFYNEMNMNRMQGPGPGGPPGQMNQGPPMGPMGPMGPMNQGPMMGPRGPMNQGPMMGPPGPMNQGPPMGPPRMMNQMNPALNPAVAFVGALLQHAAGVRQPNNVAGPMPVTSGAGRMPNPPPMGQFQGPMDQQGPFPGPGEFHGNQFNNGPPDHMGMPGMEGGQGMVNSANLPDQPFYRGPNDQRPEDVTVKNENIEENDENEKPENKDTDPNKEKLAMLGLETDNYLPSKQRELYLRINKTTEGKEEKSENTADNVNNKTESDGKVKEEDDNWYSSDEDDHQKETKLTDILKNMNRQASTPQSPSVPSSSTSTLNIMQMINAIKTGGPASATSPPIGSPNPLLRDPRQRQDPRSAGKTGATPPIIPMESQDMPVFTAPPPAIITSSDGDVAWHVTLIAVDGSPKNPPPGVNLHDPKYKNDPRVQKMLKRLEASRGQNVDSSAKSEQRQVDPRTGQPVNTGPPRSKPADDMVKPSDPRISRTTSEVRTGDPRLSRVSSNPPMGVHSLPSLDPRLGRQVSQTDMSGPVDPRLSRQTSSSGAAKPADPRMGRQISNQGDQTRLDPRTDSVPKPPRMPPVVQNNSLNNFTQNDPRKLNRQNSTPDPRTPLLPDLNLKPLGEPLINIKTDLLLDDESLEKLTINRQLSQSSTESEKGGGEPALTDKPKLDYRNDPRFKRKPAGKRKGSMEYSSPLDRDEGGEESVSSYNNYNRPPVNKPKTHPRVNKSDPRTSVKMEPTPEVVSNVTGNEEEAGGLTPPGPDLPAFVSEAEINTKDFFKTMDPTASPFC